MSGENIINEILNVYAWLDRMHLTFGILLAITGLLVLAAVFTAREAISWFLKVNDVKKDIQRLHEITLQLEGEIRTLQLLMRSEKPAAPEPPSPAPFTEHLQSENRDERRPDVGAFPISH